MAIITEAIIEPEGPAVFCPRKTKKLNPAKADVPKSHSFKKFPSDLKADLPSTNSKMIEI